MARVSYTQKSLKYLKSLGYNCGIAEKWIEAIKCRKDLFGFIDVIALRKNDTLAVQSTGPSGHTAHRREMIRNPNVRDWLEGARDHRVLLISWKKKPQKPGSKRLVWTPRTELITLNDLELDEGESEWDWNATS